MYFCLKKELFLKKFKRIIENKLLKTNLYLENLILVKCVCHSLDLCASKASEIFSDKIDFLIKETYNWFKNSVIRMHQCQQIYYLINNYCEKFYKLTKLSNTRWLSRYRAVEKIIVALETFFFSWLLLKKGVTPQTYFVRLLKIKKTSRFCIFCSQYYDKYTN
jgi:hypothetical protein